MSTGTWSDASAGLPDDINRRVRAIVEDAIVAMVRLGAERESACLLLAIQATIRIVSQADLKSLRRQIDEQIDK